MYNKPLFSIVSSLFSSLLPYNKKKHINMLTTNARTGQEPNL